MIAEKIKAGQKMVNIKSNVVIGQPIEEVFEFVTTPENDAQWYIGVESRDHTPGEPAGVGSTSQSEIRFAGVPITVEWEVTAYDPPSMIKVETINGPVSVQAGYTLERVNDGQTRLVVEGVADIEGIFSFAEPLVERMAQRQWDASFDNLKDVLED